MTSRNSLAKNSNFANRNESQWWPFINKTNKIVLVLTTFPFLLAMLAFFGWVFLLNRKYAFLVLLMFRTVSLWSMWRFRSMQLKRYRTLIDHQEGVKVWKHMENCSVWTEIVWEHEMNWCKCFQKHIFSSLVFFPLVLSIITMHTVHL